MYYKMRDERGVGRRSRRWDRAVSSGREDAWLSTPGTEDDALPRRVAAVASKRPLGPHPPLSRTGFGVVGKREGGGCLGYII